MAYQSVLHMLDPFPFATRGLNLQARDRLRPENGDTINVCVTQYSVRASRRQAL